MHPGKTCFLCFFFQQLNSFPCFLASAKSIDKSYYLPNGEIWLSINFSIVGVFIIIFYYIFVEMVSEKAADISPWVSAIRLLSKVAGWILIQSWLAHISANFKRLRLGAFKKPFSNPSCR